MNIKLALAQLVVIEGTVAITDPVTTSIKKAWPYFPPQKAALPESPAFFNSWSLPTYDNPGESQDERHEVYVVNAQLFVNDADMDRGATIATAMHVAFLAVLDANRTLSDLVRRHHLLSARLATLEWARQAYVGVDYQIELELTGT